VPDTLTAARDIHASLIRNEPMQARSTARLAALLDAAAAVVAEIGYERLTTAMVAEGAGASIGTVYRYFPDRIAVLQSLAARNEERIIERLIAVIAVPLIAIGTYLYVGSPELADLPIASRAVEPAAEGSVDDLIAKVEAHLAANPEDGRGWEILSPIYMRLGRFDDAVRALGNAKRLLGSTAERESLYGEALTRASGDVVTDEARAAFERALKLAPDSQQARFYVGLAAAQDGDKEKARGIWSKLIAEAPPGAAWADIVRERIAGLDAPASGRQPDPRPSSEEGRGIAALP